MERMPMPCGMGLALECLSKMLGNNNIATTQIYSKILNAEVSSKRKSKRCSIKKGLERSFVATFLKHIKQLLKAKTIFVLAFFVI